MAATIMDGQLISQEIMNDCAKRMQEDAKLYRVVTVGFSDEPSFLFKTRKKKADQLSIEFTYQKVTVANIAKVIAELNDHPNVTGIVLDVNNWPDMISQEKIRMMIHYTKDVEGYHPINQGLLASGHPYYVPTTALSVVEMLKFYNVKIEGKHVVVVGRGKVAGRPIADWLLYLNATVTTVHSRTSCPEKYYQSADILIAAVGHEGLINANNIHQQAVVIDVGMSKNQEGQLVGDVTHDVADVARFISLVKGGIAPIGPSVFFKQLIALSNR